MSTPVPANGIITAPGSYYLASNRTSVSTYNVQVQADDVDLNLNGKILQYSGPAGQDNYGVMANNRNNVTVYGGRIVGHQWGVINHGGNYLTVEDIDFTGCRYCGVSFSATKTGLRVRRNVFASIAGWTGGAAYAIGINGVGIGALIEYNKFRGLYRQVAGVGVGEGCAVLVSAGVTGAVIRYNWFENQQYLNERDIAIWLGVNATATIGENTVTGFGRGFIGSAGSSASAYNNRLAMRSPEAGSNGIHMSGGSVTENILSGYDTPVSGAASQSGNLILP